MLEVDSLYTLGPKTPYAPCARRLPMLAVCMNQHTHHACIVYHMSLLALSRAKRWLSAAEQVPDLAPSVSTPKTLGQLRRALEDPLVAPHLPFAADFEDGAGYGPIVSRLLFYAEMSAARHTSYGTYSKPYRAPQTYGQLQEIVFAQREQHTSGVQVHRRVETADDHIGARTRHWWSRCCRARRQGS